MTRYKYDGCKNDGGQYEGWNAQKLGRLKLVEDDVDDGEDWWTPPVVEDDNADYDNNDDGHYNQD